MWAPVAIQLAMRSRSSWVIWVMLPNGMIWLATLWAWIFAACWRICSGVSNITPAGALANIGLLGLAVVGTTVLVCRYLVRRILGGME